MFARIRWQIAAIYLGLTVVITAGLLIALRQDACIANAGCVRQNVLIAGLLMAIATIIVAHFVAERTARPLRQLTDVIRRITNGDRSATLLATRKDEVGSLITAFSDMREQLNQEYAALAETDHQLSTAVTHLADGLIITDAEGQLLHINPAAAQFLDVNQADALNRSFAEVVRHHTLILLWQSVQEDNVAQVEIVEMSSDLILQTTVTPIMQQDRQQFLIDFHNLTDLQRLQTIRQDFISNISHELRTPLASIGLIMETLQESIVDDPAATRRFLSRAEHEVGVMTQMVEELLELSRIESGQVPLKLKETAVSDLIMLPVERISKQARRSHISLVVDLPAGLPLVLADAGRIQQVLSNLLHNAVKFTPEHGTIIINASIKPKKHPNQLIISVQDSGIGIQPEDIDRVFERFYKTDRARTRHQKGTGLGLSICRHLVEAHNGRIWVKSKPNKGSTFFFTLPQHDS